MSIVRKRGLVLAAAAVAGLALAGSALALTQAGPPRNPPRAGLQQGMWGAGGMMAVAADYLGVSVTELMNARHDGKSFAQIAVANGKTAAGLEAALVTSFEANLDKAVAAGRLTEVQATQALATFKSQVGTMVSRTGMGPLPGHGPGMGAGMGFGMGGGMGSGHCGGGR